MSDPTDTVDPLGSFRLHGKVALVTGASSGIGARFARVLSGLGATVVVSARRTDRITALASTLERGDAIACDVGERGASSTLVDATGERHQPIHGGVANASLT